MKFLLLILVFCYEVKTQVVPSSFSLSDYYPKKDENNREKSEGKASGPIRDVIKRNSPRFRRVLVRNLNEDVIFANDDARFMTSRAKSKLDILAALVRSRWSTDRVRVLKAWTDVVEPTDLLSLHYEGRAFQVQLRSDKSNYLSDLIKLAIKAGFDWVYYKTQNYTHISVIPDVCQSKLDLSIIVDTSGSVGYSNFVKVRTFLKNLIDYFNVGLDETRVAVISYSYTTRVEYYLNSYSTKWQMKAAIDRIWYQGSSTATGNALAILRNNVYSTQRGMREDKSIPKIGILMTDGYTNLGSNVYVEAGRVRKAGINMFVVGLTTNVHMSEIQSIASPPWEEHYIPILKFTDLSSFVDQISTISCDEGAQLSQCENAKTKVDGGSFKYFKTKFDGTDRISVEVTDIKGKSFLYTSFTEKNPGPLSSETEKNEILSSPRVISLKLKSDAETIVYIAVQGQEEENIFDLSIWDSLFAQHSITKTIAENQAKNYLVATAQTQVNPQSFRYKIKDGAHKADFQINPSNGQIRTTRPLDREKVSEYQLSIIAEDLSAECHKGLMVLKVIVKDVDDSTPRFESDVYTTSLREDTPSNQYVIQVKAVDADVGTNAELIYEIYGTDKDVFQIVASTGVIKTRQRLDYETRKTYSIKLRVSDKGSTLDYGEAVLNVQILDRNEPPKFSVCQNTCVFTLKENEAADTPVGHQLTASDPDTQQACTLSYKIQSLDKRYFKIGKNNGQISTILKLDREVKSSYSLDVIVEDCGSPKLSAQTSVRVNVEDVNDNRPVFASPYTLYISEGAAVNTPLTTVKATDADLGNNGKVKYKISGNDYTGSVSIEATSGVLSLVKLLDRETQSTVNVVVTATDMGVKPLSSSVDVKIIVKDINDNTPVFTGKTTFDVVENVDIGTLVTTLSATDKDDGLNKDVRFSIQGGNTDDIFTISSNAQLRTQKQPDRESRDRYTLVMKAQDLGSPPKSTTKSFHINISDENDNSPVFEKAHYQLSVKENAAARICLLTVKATDDDFGSNAAMIYSINAGNSDERFEIDRNLGQIDLVKNLDFNDDNHYRLHVRATDKGQPPNTGTTFIDVNVLDSNDFAPVITNEPYNVHVDENVKLDTKVMTISATDSDKGTSGDLSFSITSNTNPPFKIHPATGVITTTRNIDYESRTSYTFKVVVKDKSTQPRKDETQILINVNDMNDETPVLQDYIVDVLEDKTPKDDILTLVGSDGDSGTNALLDYSLITSNVPFIITGDKLELDRSLDREVTDKYILKVNVSDRGTPVKSSVATVTLIVLDVNDNDPEFTKAQFYCEVSENMPIGSQFCTARATDKDLGKNAELVYSLSDESNFRITDIGTIHTKRSFDRESTTANFNLRVTATDKGDKPRSSNVPLTIKILDRNDNKPKFSTDEYTFNVQEEQDNASVGDVIATDRDAGKNSDIVYSIVSNDVDITNKFSVQKDSSNGHGKIAANRLDREARDKYRFIIKATDQGNPSMFSEAQVNIQVTDINDNMPNIMENTYNANVMENGAVGTLVVEITANDLDIDANGVIKYFIKSGDNADHFKLNKDTGVITTATVLDYESITSYDLVVETKDGGNPVREDTARVLISVLNEDDNAPKFEEVKAVSVLESSAVNQQVMQFKATDLDGSSLTFRILGGNTADVFKINPTTGLFSIKNSLDRETTDFYNVSVAASDGVRDEVVYLPITILDANDNYPKFLLDRYVGRLTEEKDNFRDDVAVTVSAKDRDLGSNAAISYSITSGNEAGVFVIDPDTGEITSQRKLDREHASVYNLRVTAADHGSPVLSSVVQVTVNIDDVNDHYPRFLNTPYRAEIAENSAKRTPVYTVEAVDIDNGENGTVTFTIAGTNFVIDATSGEIRTNTELDRETKDAYTITVVASDGGLAPLSISVNVSLTIIDVNDNDPQISTSSIAPLNESLRIGANIVKISASDVDHGSNSELHYVLRDSRDVNLFSINETSGDITLKEMLDRETAPILNLSVAVSDMGAVRRETVRNYEIVVLDANDNAPLFSYKHYAGSLTEGLSNKVNILNFTATDADIDENADVGYSLVNTYDGTFEIDVKTGRLSAVKTVDFEETTSFELNVTASDWRFMTRVPVRITVENVNDNPPKFPFNYTATVLEYAPLGTDVTAVEASDPDPFAGLEYFISTSVPFAIDRYSGKITTSRLLDREKRSSYEFKVVARDSGYPKSLSGETYVTVIVEDVNDNAPEFQNYTQVVRLLENEGVKKVLTNVMATDKDVSSNAVVRYKEHTPNADFSLDPVSGEVTTRKVFDRESIANTKFFYIAYDMGTPRLNSKVRELVVNIIDVNDNSPEWSNDYSLEIAEDHRVDEQVVLLHATDVDQGDNGLVRYYIADSEDAKSFRVNAITGMLTLRKQLDRETKDNYTFHVVARDNGTKARETMTTVNVKVLDVNDNKPMFDTSSLTGDIAENKAASYILTVQATDADLGRNSEFTYTLHHELFTVDPESGQISSLSRLDREEQSTYVVKVTATDKGKPFQQNSADVRITVTDRDDNCPLFDSPFYQASLIENADYGTVVLNVSATDKDIGSNAYLNYGILSSDDRGAFSIDQFSGVITVAKSSSVDRDYADTYTLVIRAGSTSCGIMLNDTNVDEGDGTPIANNFTMTTVSIAVSDLNDNAPVFSVANVKVVRYDDFTQKKIASISATDKDLGSGGMVGYRLGRVVRARDTYTVSIIAFDHGTPVQSSTYQLNVTTKCEALSFNVDSSGEVTATSLCGFSVGKSSEYLVSERLLLNCSTYGNTPADFQWQFNSAALTSWSDSGELIIESLSEEDEGSYYCLASSIAGLIVSDANRVTVNEKPRITKQPFAATVGEKERVVMEIVATSDPVPIFEWYKNGKVMYKYRSNQIELESAGNSDMGSYFCNVSNKVGWVKSEVVNLHVMKQDTVVAISIKLTETEKQCHEFFPGDFAEQTRAILNQSVFVTKYTSANKGLCNITACSKNPCKNGGTCKETADGFECVCSAFWEGSTCEQNINECTSAADTCYNNGNCTDSVGSFTCKCPQAFEGLRCEYSADACTKHNCSEICVPTTSGGFNCLLRANELTLRTKADGDWSAQKTLAFQAALNRIIKTSNVNKGNRKRRSIKEDFGACTIHIVSYEKLNSGAFDVNFVLDCETKFTPSAIKVLCDQLFRGDRSIAQCGQPAYSYKPTVVSAQPVTVSVNIVVVDKEGRTLSATQVLDSLSKPEFSSELEKHNYKVLAIKQAYVPGERGGEDVEDSLTTTIIVVVVCVLILILLILIAVVGAVFVLKKRKPREKNFGTVMQKRSVLHHEASTSELIPVTSPYNSGKENLGYTTSNTGSEGSAFMYEMKTGMSSSNLQDTYQSLYWFHGNLTPRQAEQQLASREAGQYLLYKDTDDRGLAIAVKAPEGGPSVRHLAVHEEFDGKFRAQFGVMDVVTFNSPQKIVEYYRVHSIEFDDSEPTVLFTEPCLKE